MSKIHETRHAQACAGSFVQRSALRCQSGETGMRPARPGFFIFSLKFPEYFPGPARKRADQNQPQKTILLETGVFNFTGRVCHFLSTE
jgi:hypothetical protein